VSLASSSATSIAGLALEVRSCTRWKLAIFCSLAKLIVGLINGAQQLREVRCVLDRPQAVESGAEQAHVRACEKPYADNVLAGHCW
jgi:hypothetical protein